MLWSVLRQLMVHSSTTSSSTLPLGSDCAIRAARARPLTPPAQPRPKMGSRSIVAGRPRRLARIASRLGTASPVVDTVTMASMSSGSMPARSMHSRLARSRRSAAASWNTRLRAAQPCDSKCHSRGTHEWRVLDAGVEKEGCVAAQFGRDGENDIASCPLIDAMLGHCRRERCDCNARPGVNAKTEVLIWHVPHTDLHYS